MNAWTICVSACICCAALLPAGAQEAAAEPPPQSFRQGVVIALDGVILPRTQRYLERKLEQSQKLGADLVILDIDSPGGELEATLNMAGRLRDLSWAHTVAYIPQEALSGAAIVALACDDIVMAPAARLGDAGPLVVGPDALFRHAPEKIRSHLARWVRDLATATGRPPALAEAMVDADLEVFRVVNRQSGHVTYMSQHEIEASGGAGVWEKGPLVLESRAGSFLEVNGQRAVELQLATATVRDAQQLAQRYPVAEPLRRLEEGAVDVTVDVLNLPLVTALLLVIGAVALYFELSAPGIGLGGLIAGLCFTLFFWSRFLGGTAGWLEVILVLAGAAFLAVEIFVLPGFGIAGMTGLLLIASGIVLASQNHVIPQSPRALADLGKSLAMLLSSGVVSVLIAAALTRYFGSVPILSRMVLRTPGASAPNPADAAGKPLPPVRRFEAVVGDQGVSQCPLRPAGKAIFGQEYLDVVTDGSYVERDRPVRIIQISGNRIMVREVDA
jgi:membrane-bound serine protease (ClpP class)